MTVLSGRARATAVALSALVALLLTACAGGEQEGEPVTIGVADDSAIEPVAFDAIGPGDCVGDTSAVDGMVPAVPCDVPGAIPVLSVVVLGQDAPAERPEPTVVSGYAIAACQDAFREYADAHEVPISGLLQVVLVSDTEWLGADTPAVCAVAESG